MSVHELLERLDGVKESGRGRWNARCPAHQDKGPSLSIREAEDGRTLLHCFAGCSARDVVESVGLTMRELFPRTGGDFDRRAYKQKIVAADTAKVLHFECLVLMMALSDMEAGRPVDKKRLALARQKLEGVLEALS